MKIAIAIPSQHPSYPDHFPGRTVVPGVLLLDLIMSACVQQGITLSSIKMCKFLHPVLPGACAELSLNEVQERWEARLSIADQICLDATFNRQIDPPSP